MPAVEYRAECEFVVFCQHRERRHPDKKGIICPGGVWVCTNPDGHCSAVSTCGVTGVTIRKINEKRVIRNNSLVQQPKVQRPHFHRQ